MEIIRCIRVAGATIACAALMGACSDGAAGAGSGAGSEAVVQAAPSGSAVGGGGGADGTASSAAPRTGAEEATGQVGPVSYTFLGGLISTCVVLLEPLTVTVVALIDAATGATLTVNYDAEAPADTEISIAHLQGHQWISPADPAEGNAVSVNDDGSVTLTGTFVDRVKGGPTRSGGVTISC